MTHQIFAILFLIAAVVALLFSDASLDRYHKDRKILLIAKSILLFLPAVLAALTVGFHLINNTRSENAVSPLGGPILFVLCAVPLSILLDKLGFFSLIASEVLRRQHGLFILWILASIVTATLNLDTAVVLLTPIYVGIARKKQLPPLTIAIQPALLSGIASLFLPISNVTNLIMTSKFDLSATNFLEHLGLSGILAVAVGYFFYRISYPQLTKVKTRSEKPSDLHPPDVASLHLARDSSQNTGPLNKQSVLLLGSIVCILAAAGFTFIPLVGGSPWEVALCADIILMIVTKNVPWRHVPLRIAINVLSLAILASSFEFYVHFSRLLSVSSNLATIRTGVLSGIFSDLANNLPSTLGFAVALGKHRLNAVWAILVGTDIGSLFLPGGSLAVMLWLTTLRRLDVNVSGTDYLKYAWKVALPAFLAALGGLLLLKV